MSSSIISDLPFPICPSNHLAYCITQPFTSSLTTSFSSLFLLLLLISFFSSSSLLRLLYLYVFLSNFCNCFKCWVLIQCQHAFWLISNDVMCLIQGELHYCCQQLPTVYHASLKQLHGDYSKRKCTWVHLSYKLWVWNHALWGSIIICPLNKQNVLHVRKSNHSSYTSCLVPFLDLVLVWSYSPL